MADPPISNIPTTTPEPAIASVNLMNSPNTTGLTL